MPVEPDCPKPHSQTWIDVMLYITMRFYAEKYRSFWEWSPLIHKKGIHVKVSLRKLIKEEGSACCCPKSDNRVVYALLSFC